MKTPYEILSIEHSELEKKYKNECEITWISGIFLFILFVIMMAFGYLYTQSEQEKRVLRTQLDSICIKATDIMNKSENWKSELDSLKDWRNTSPELRQQKINADREKRLHKTECKNIITNLLNILIIGQPLGQDK